MTEPVKLLLMFVNEADRWNDAPLYQAIVHRLRQLNIAGATAQAGDPGLRAPSCGCITRACSAISDDRPVTITAVDDEGKIRACCRSCATWCAKG